ncbi:cytidylate kinase [candidate division WOR-3 bacterium JGI_Cruoil_03_44_89]|uniref:Cytidylate kinase n=1 Tax=candidate division WOR-3 bacterium JGI_Cruoil_03_44_89 TaxID=1973748 RepID=A0A235BPM1_UNCW3|nr:MAG: cytidylate kinase [candidate division WOR-3 bacterium JGI_Cruoil_03_44_89]
MVVTIDGTSASGKSTAAKEVSKRLGFVYIDTGAMYRAVALYCIENGIDIRDRKAVTEASLEVDIRFEFKNDINHIFLNGGEVTDRIRTEEVGSAASTIATYNGVRVNLVEKQREMGRKGNVICEGRDIGTIVFKNADVKIYMDADLVVRARRRHRELGEIGDLRSIMEAIERRDKQDKTRDESPLKLPDGAVIIDTTHLSIEEEVKRVIEAIKQYNERDERR